jgi:CheY-like chemotaxis protein
LVDDHAELRRVWARALRRLGHEITEATSGTEALARLGEQRFDFVLSDVQMPDMTGLELLENVRTLDPDLAFALLTGAPDASSIARAMELGVFEYLTKPVDLAKLTASVGRGVLRTQKRRERAPQSG